MNIRNDEIIKLLSKFNNKIQIEKLEKIKDTSLKIFDTICKKHKLNIIHKEILYISSLLSEVGKFIDQKNFEKHSKYIVLNDEALDYLSDKMRRDISIVVCSLGESVDKSINELNLDKQKALLKIISIIKVSNSMYDSNFCLGTKPLNLL